MYKIIKYFEIIELFWSKYKIIANHCYILPIVLWNGIYLFKKWNTFSFYYYDYNNRLLAYSFKR